MKSENENENENEFDYKELYEGLQMLQNRFNRYIDARNLGADFLKFVEEEWDARKKENNSRIVVVRR